MNQERPARHGAGTPENLEIRIVGHSNIIYWWPVWLFGYVMFFITYFMEPNINTGPSWYSLTSLVYLELLLFIIMVTNIRFEGAAAINVILGTALLVMLAWLAFGKVKLLETVPALLVFANANFYLVFSSALLLMWLFAVLFYDRRTVWLVEPSIFIAHQWPSKNIVLDRSGAKFSVIRDDIACHMLLGLGRIGDIRVELRTGPMMIPNVVGAGRIVRQANRISAIQMVNHSRGK